MKKRRLRWLKVTAAVLISVGLVKTLLVTSCFIPSAGMENSLYQGEGVLVNKWSYGLRLPLQAWWGYHRIGASRVEKGDIVVFNSPMPREEHTAVERRPLYISRCIGSAGDTLMLNKDLIQVEGPVFSPDAKDLYVYPADQEERLLALLDTLGIQGNLLAGYTEDGSYIRSFSYYESYLISQKVGKSLPLVPLNERHPEKAYPFVVPAKGQVVKVYPWNVTLLCNTIRLHEHRQATIKGDTLYVEGSPVGHYCFSKDYYWVASNDPVNLRDSRLFGFVPEDHLIGKAWRVWYPVRLERFWQWVQ